VISRWESAFDIAIFTSIALVDLIAVFTMVDLLIRHCG
jgi:hypothetical protein